MPARGGRTPGSVVVITGPTASGKSALAVDVAEAFGGTVINADSMQVYRELRVLTARPTAADEARAAHRLFGVLAAAEVCSAGRWLDLAVVEIEAARAAGRLPVVVGGTGFYLRALRQGLAPIPAVPAAVREDLRARHAAIGAEAFHAELAAVDAETAARLPAGDTQRMIRALEVYRATGRTLGYWFAQPAPRPPIAARFVTVILAPPRHLLHAAIERRFDAMMAAGALDEARALVALGLDGRTPVMKALGVRELVRHLKGEIPLAEAVSLAKLSTRQFAKRQMTWLRPGMAGALTANEQYSECLKEKIFPFIRRNLLTDGT